MIISIKKQIIRRPDGETKTKISNRYKTYYLLMNEWFEKVESGKNVGCYLEAGNTKNMAIYGCGSLGRRLLQQIKESKICVKCFIDSRIDTSSFEKTPVMSLKDLSSIEIDTIIVTPIYDFEKIKEKIESITNEIKVLSLEDVIYQL